MDAHKRSGRSATSTGTGSSPGGTVHSRPGVGNRSGHSSRAPSRMRMGGSVFFNPLSSKGSRSFLGSKSSLSSSKRNLASESMRALAAQATLLDEDGFDVTPVSLLQPDYSAIKRNQVIFLKSDKESTPNVSLFQSSIYGMGIGGPSASVIHAPFSSMTDMSASAMSISLTEEFKNLPESRQSPHEAALEGSESFEAPKELAEQDLEKEVEIILSETETLCMLDIPGICVDANSEEADRVQESNDKYEKLLKTHSGNDNYTERHVQTINDAPKFKLVQTEALKSKDVGVIVSTWDMYSTYEALKNEQEASGEETLEELSSRAASRMTDTSSSRVPTAMGGENAPMDDNIGSSTRIPGETSIAMSMIQSSGSFDNPNIVRRPKSEEVVYDPSVPNDHPILKMGCLIDRFRTMERAITQNNYHPKQALYRNLEPIEDPDYPSSGVTINISTPHLDKLWSYACPLTKRRKVTCMAWNNANQDIIAVGYGTFKADEDSTGLICCWSLKNPQFPERIFHAPSGITSLSFSKKNPNLLAAGLFNGTIVLYNARSDSHESVLDSRDALHKHSGPVWKMNWVMKEHSLGESRSENLVTISTDGHVLQWSIRKGFESTQLMNLKRQVSNKQHMKKAKSKASVAPASIKHGASPKAPMGPGGGEAYISHHAPGMGFDFWPRDPNIYLACTDEGFIHKCSCSYNEQVLETYVGHNGPVYHVSWSPFVSDFFLSCSADWSVKLWVQDKTTPIQSFSAAQKSVNDVCWSPFCSTMFGCVSEGRVEIWNLEYSSLDPMIVHRPLSNAVLTSITFAKNSKVVLVGDTDGEVSVYLLNNLQTLPTNQEEALLTAVSSMSKREHMVVT